jgi:hypothetical protein
MHQAPERWRWRREYWFDVLVSLEQWSGRTSAEPVGHCRRDPLVAARAAVALMASFAVAATNEPAEVTQCAVKATTTAGTTEDNVLEVKKQERENESNCSVY